MQEIINKFSIFSQQEFVFLGLFAIMFLDLVYFLTHFLTIRSFIKSSEKSMAQVSAVNNVENEKGGYQELTLVFKDSYGLEFAPVFVNMYTPRQRGDRVEVYYKKNDPANLIINEWRVLHLKSFVSFAALIISAAVGYYMLQQGLMVIPKNLF